MNIDLLRSPVLGSTLLLCSGPRIDQAGPDSSGSFEATPLDSVLLSQRSLQLGMARSTSDFLGRPGYRFTGQPAHGFRGARPCGGGSQAQQVQGSSQGYITRKLSEAMGKILTIAEKLKAVNLPGLAGCINLVNGLVGALQAGIKGDFETCARELLKAGKGALTIAKASGRLGGRVAARSLPAVSLVVSLLGGHEAKKRAQKARAMGSVTAAVLWEVKGLCESAIAALSALQLVTAPSAALPAGLEAGILAVSLVSELVAEAAENAEKEADRAAGRRPGNPADLPRAIHDNVRIVRQPPLR